MSACCDARARQNEKAQLQELNDRLLHYVQNVKNMRDQLSKVDKCAELNRIWDMEEEMLSIRNMYNSEIQVLRDQLEQNCKERMQIEICNHKNSQLIAEFRESVMALNACIMQKDEEKKKLEVLLVQKEAELKEIQDNTTSCIPQLEVASRELEILHRNIAEIQAKYEKEHREALDLQCQIQHLKHSLDVQQEFHCKEIQKMRDKVDESEILIQRLEEKLRRDTRCDSEAMDLVKRIRDTNEAELMHFQEQAEKAYNQNIIDLTARLNKDHVELQQIRDENRCLRRHINDLTVEVKTLQSKLLYEEETKIAFIEKMTCEHQRNQQHIQILKTRLEEMQDLVLAKMKELSSQDKSPCLQGDIESITAVLDDEEKKIRESQVQCCLRKSSANARNRFPVSCIPLNLLHCPLPTCQTPCTSTSQPLCPPVSGLSSCTTPSHPLAPPVAGLSSCNSASQPPPCLSSCTPPRQPLCPPVPCLSSCPPTSQPLCPSAPCLTSCTSTSQPFYPAAPIQMSCASANHSHSLSTGLASCGVANSLCCPHSSSLASCSSGSDPHYTMAPTMYKASTSSAQPCSCTAPPEVHSKPCQTAGLQKIGHENCVAHCSDDETKRHCSRPSSHSVDNKIGQGRDYFNTMFKELKKDSLYSKCPGYKFSPTTCEQNRPSTSTIGNVKIIEVSSSGHFVRILNNSCDKEEDIGNFIVQQNVGGHPVLVYRFPPRTRLKPGRSATVWAAIAKIPHNPPTDFLWKEQHKFGTGPECTTILCSPNGQAISWFTPGYGKARCQYDTSHYNPLLTPEENRNQTEQCDDPKVASDIPSVEPAICKRAKTSPILAPIKCPWGQSPASITHPDYCLPRTLSLGNDGSSLCRDSRSQSSRPDPDSGTLYAGFPTSGSQKKCPTNKSNTKSTTCSTKPNQRGTLHVGIPTPFASPFQRYYADAAFNIKFPSDSQDFDDC